VWYRNELFKSSFKLRIIRNIIRNIFWPVSKEKIQRSKTCCIIFFDVRFTQFHRLLSTQRIRVGLNTAIWRVHSSGFKTQTLQHKSTSTKRICYTETWCNTLNIAMNLISLLCSYESVQIYKSFGTSAVKTGIIWFFLLI
jgi:hypothetical protein